MDIGRGLERVECRVTQYADSGESVMPVGQVMERVSVDLPRAFKVFQNPANVSGSTVLNSYTLIFVDHPPSFIYMYGQIAGYQSGCK